jgi:hypothetical protein
MTTNQSWLIVKIADGTCQIVADDADLTAATAQWGPYASREEAIAKRIGLIRASKCQPVQ